MCAVNSYDLSGDRPSFVGTTVNRPDLLPIAKTIEYAEARDFPAVLADCASSEVAQHMVRSIPPHVSAVGDLNIKPVGPLRKLVELHGDRTARFTVEKRAGRWLITAFRMD